LVLEEDETLREGLCGLLAAAGYAPADNPAAAMRGGQIDLVLAGMGAGQSPKAALDLLRRAVPVILLVDRTGWTGFNFFDVANDLGAVAVLQRPFPRAALLRLMADVLTPPRRQGVAVADPELPASAEFTSAPENTKFI
jgi:hypothetical protein